MAPNGQVTLVWAETFVGVVIVPAGNKDNMSIMIVMERVMRNVLALVLSAVEVDTLALCLLIRTLWASALPGVSIVHAVWVVSLLYAPACM